MFKIIRIATEELAAFLETWLPKIDHRWYQSRVLRRLKGPEKKQLTNRTAQRLQGLELRTLLRLTRSAWRDLSKEVPLSDDGLFWVHEIESVERRWATRAASEIGPDQAYRDVDTLWRLLRMLGASDERLGHAEERRQALLAEMTGGPDEEPDKMTDTPEFAAQETVRLRPNPALTVKLLEGRRGLYGWRYLARLDGTRVLVNATSLLAKSDVDGDAGTALAGWLAAAVRNGGVVSMETLVRKIDGRAPEAESIGQLRLVAAVLESHGFGVVPDPRFGLRTPELGERVVVFRLATGTGRPTHYGRAYVFELVTMVLGTFVAHADSRIDSNEREHLRHRIESNEELSGGEKARLQANLRWMLAVPPDPALVRHRVGLADESVLRSLANTAIAIAESDGHIHQAEVGVIERVFAVLGLKKAVLDEALATLARKRAASSGSQAHMEKESPNPKKTIELDPEGLGEVRSDWNAMAQMLGSVFAVETVPVRETEADAISVDVYRNGVLVRTITRTPRMHDGAPAVTFRRRQWPLINGNEIHLDKEAPAKEIRGTSGVGGKSASGMITVGVFRNGKLLKSIERPVHSLEGRPAVRFRRRLWHLIQGREIHLDREDAAVTAAADRHGEAGAKDAAAGQEPDADKPPAEAPETIALPRTPAADAVTRGTASEQEHQPAAPDSAEEEAKETAAVDSPEPAETGVGAGATAPPAETAGETTAVHTDTQPEDAPESDSSPARGTSESVALRWQEAGELVVGPCRPLLDALRQAGVPAPEIGFELAGARHGVVAMAELAWSDEKVAVLWDEEWLRKHYFKNAGWEVFPVVADTVAQVSAALS